MLHSLKYEFVDGMFAVCLMLCTSVSWT